MLTCSKLANEYACEHFISLTFIYAPILAHIFHICANTHGGAAAARSCNGKLPPPLRRLARARPARRLGVYPVSHRGEGTQWGERSPGFRWQRVDRTGSPPPPARRRQPSLERRMGVSADALSLSVSGLGRGGLPYRKVGPVPNQSRISFFFLIQLSRSVTSNHHVG